MKVLEIIVIEVDSVVYETEFETQETSFSRNAIYRQQVHSLHAEKPSLTLLPPFHCPDYLCRNVVFVYPKVPGQHMDRLQHSS